MGWNENEVTRAHGFGTFAVAAPADLSTAAEHVNDGFLLTVVVHGTGGMRLGNHYAATDMGGAGKIAVDGGEAQNPGGLRRVAVEVIVAGNTNVGHHLRPQMGCQGVRGCCRLLGSCHPGKAKAPVCESVHFPLRCKILEARMLRKLHAASVRMLDACRGADSGPTDGAPTRGF